MSPSSGARGLGQYMKLRQSDGSSLNVIDTQAREDVRSGRGEGCAFGEQVSTKLAIYPDRYLGVGSSRTMIV